MKKLLPFLVVLIVLSSCAGPKSFYNLPQEEIHFGTVETEEATVEMAYIGALGRNYIFECTVKNISERDIYIDQQEFVLYVDGKDELQPVDPNSEIRMLNKEQKKLEKRKKSNTILAIFGAGLTVAAGAATGAPVAETIFYAAEPLSYMADDNAWSNRNIKSVEEEIDYLNKALFANQLVKPGASVTKDVIFSIEKIRGDATLVLFIDEQEYAVGFDRELFNH